MGIEIKELISAGKFVPDDVIIKLFQETVKSHESAQGFLFDGYPRNMVQACSFQLFLARAFPNGKKSIIFLDVSEKELLHRIAGRKHVEQRVDDDPETFKKRLEVYKKETLPMVDYFRGFRVCRRVIGTGKQPEEVAAKIANVLMKRFGPIQI